MYIYIIILMNMQLYRFHVTLCFMSYCQSFRRDIYQIFSYKYKIHGKLTNYVIHKYNK